MHVIGIVGGVASGKSWVAQQFARFGAAVLDADIVGHEVLRLPEVEEAIRARYGAEVFDDSGRVNRRAVARIVFAPPPDGPRELKFLEQLAHPKIGQRLKEEIASFAAQDVPAVVLDAAVLLEAGWHQYCTKIVFVDAPRDVRLTRAAARGWSEEQFAAREQAQRPLADKRAVADLVIDNSQSAKATEGQIEAFWHTLLDGSQE